MRESLPGSAVATHRAIPRWVMALAMSISLLLHFCAFVAVLHVGPRAPGRREQVITVRLIPASVPHLATTLPTKPAPATKPVQHSPAPLVQTSRASPAPDTPPSRDVHPQASTVVARVASKSRIANPLRNPRPATHINIDSQSTPARLGSNSENLARNAPSPYLDALTRRLAQVKEYPAAAIAQHEQGVVMVSFLLDRSGELLSWHIAQSSGYPDLDAEVARMVTTAAPYPPFPALWAPSEEAFSVPITFALP